MKNGKSFVVARCVCGGLLLGDKDEGEPYLLSKCPFCESDLIQKGVKA